jgi:autotransporter-associated beta strand protein
MDRPNHRRFSFVSFEEITNMNSPNSIYRSDRVSGHSHHISGRISSAKIRFNRIAYLSLIVLLALVPDASAQTIDNIGSTSDLNTALQSIQGNQSSPYTLNFINGFSLNQAVSNLTTNSTITLAGNNYTIDGGNSFSPFVINGGTVVLQNLNIINSAPAITINSGTLNTTTDSLLGTIANNGTVLFNAGTVGTTAGDPAGTYSGVISGSGNVLINNDNNTGAVTFTGLNTYSGGTTINTNATLNGTTDSLVGNFTNNGAMLFNAGTLGGYDFKTGTQDEAGVYSGNITGSGTVEVSNSSGNGPVAFMGINSYTGGTTIDSQATLIGTTDSLQGHFNNNGWLQFYQGTNSSTYGGVISGSGVVQISGTGPVTFTGLNNYTGGTTIDTGSTLIGTTDSLQGSIFNTGAVQLTAGTLGSALGDQPGTYSGVMSGAGSVEISGTGPITFTGMNSYYGGTTIDQQATLIGTTDSLQGLLTNNGTLQISAGTNGSAGNDPPGLYSGVISGTGNVIISGTGQVAFSGPNSYSGGTTIDQYASLLGTTDSLQGNMLNNGALQFYAGQRGAANNDPAGTYSGVISGAGTVEISGSAAVTFTGLNSYSGGTTIDQNSMLIGTTDSLQGNFNNSGIIQFSAGTLGNASGGTAGTYSGVVSGTGGVEISGSSPVTFTGQNSYSGGTLIDPSATLVGTTDSIQGRIYDYGIVQMYAGTLGNAGGDPAGTYSNIISGTGGVEISGTGPVTFTGLNSYSGGTLIDSGATLIGTTDSLQGTLYNNGAIQFNAGTQGAAGGGTAGTYSGAIIGTGSVEINNSSNNGSVTFTGQNYYSGGTTIDKNASLIGTTDSLQGNITNNGAIQFNAGTHGSAAGDAPGVYSGVISGSGSVEISNSSKNGPVYFTGLNSYTGGTTVNQNATLVGTTDSVQGNVANNGNLQFFAGTKGSAGGDPAGTYSGVISGSGRVEISGTGPVTFSGANTYTGGTTVDSQSVLIGTTTSLQGNITNNWLVNFNQTTAGTYSGVISGTGGVEITGGPVTFTGLNNYTGGTQVDISSTLIGTTSTVQGNIYDSGGVAFSQSTSGTYAGTIYGVGAVAVTGGGIVTFSGVNAYTGGTTIDLNTTLIGNTSSLQGSINDYGTLKFIQATSGTFNGNLFGTGSLEIGGGGTVTLSGTNSFTGGTIIDAGSTLAGTTDNLNGSLIDNGTLNISQGQSTSTYATAVSGTGGVEISTGIVTFSGANTYSGGTTIDNGAALVGTTSSLQGTIFNNGEVQFNQGGKGTYSGNMSGTGGVEISGGGSMTFTGTNSYSGGTLIDYGSALIGTTNSLQGAFVNNGTVQFDQNTSGTYSGAMVGQGRVEISGKGPITFTGQNTYTGGTTIDAASTLIGTSNSLQGLITNNGFVLFNQNASGIFTGDMSGTGSVEISGGGPMTFSGSNSYTGGTTLDKGNSLYGTTDGIQGNFVNNGAIQFNQTMTGTYGGNMSGTGSVEISGKGPITFSGTNSYTGGTTVDKGSTLIGTTSSVQGSILNNGALQFNQNTNGTYTGSISGTGGVELSGFGQTTFSGKNTYTGGTTVDNNSTLIISSTGSIVGNINVNNNGTLMGSGTYGTTTINGGGTIYPGTVGAPMTINGNFTQNTGSTFSAELNPTGSDKIIVNGAAHVSTGTTLNLSLDAGTYNVGNKYELLTASGGLTGTYANQVTSSINQYVVFTQQYTPNALQLSVNSNLSSVAQTSNQASLAAAIDQSSGSATGSYANVLTQLTTLNSGQVNNALNQISGSIYPSLSTIERQTSTAQLQLLSNRLAGMTGPGVPAVAATPRRNNIRFVSTNGSSAPDNEEDDDDDSPLLSSGPMSWTGWIQGYGLGGNIGSDGNASATNYRLGGTLFGFDRWLDESTMIGVLGGYAGTSVGTQQVSSTAQITSYQAGLYELHRRDSFYISNIDAFTNDAFNVSRSINFGTIQETASGNSSGNQWSHYTEAGSIFDIDDLKLQPFLGVQYMYLNQQGYTESGAGSLDLTTSHQIVNSVRNVFGVRLAGETMLGRFLVTPMVAARYLREWGDGTQLISSSVAGAPTVQFATAGNKTGRDFGVFTLGANAFLSDHFSLYGTVDTQVASSFYAIIGSGGFQYSW